MRAASVSVKLKQEEGRTGRETAGDVAQERLLGAVIGEEVHDVEAGGGRKVAFLKVGDVPAHESDALGNAGFAQALPGNINHLARRIDAGQSPRRFRRLEGNHLDPRPGPDHEHPRARPHAPPQEGERLPKRAQIAWYHGAGELFVVAAVGSVEVKGLRAPVRIHEHKETRTPDSVQVRMLA